MKELLLKWIYRTLSKEESPLRIYSNNINKDLSNISTKIDTVVDNMNEHIEDSNSRIIDSYKDLLLLNSNVDRFLLQYNTKREVAIPDHFVSYFYDTYGRQNNLGDYIQSIATERAISICMGKECTFIPVQRNKLVNHSGGTCIMQGWYEHEDLGFLPGPDTRPIWIGTHFNETTCQSLALLFKKSAIRLYDVGCRDKATLDFCRQFDIPSYFSRCLTLTFPKRTIEETENASDIYIVDCRDDILSLLPQEISFAAKICNQRGFIRESWKPWEICRDAAQKRLKEYKDNAKLVITTALHCAQPCIAMGIPVVFITPEYDERNRFSSMDGIIPQYTISDLKNNRIDFNPIVPDIEILKTAILTNLKLCLKEELSIEEKNLLFESRKLIEEFNILD